MCKAAICIIIFLILLFSLTIQGHSKAVLSGQVIKVDRDGNTITVKIAGQPVNLDISNLSLKSYKNIDEIKKNDWINITYTSEGTVITRPLKKQVDITQKEIKSEKAAETKKIHFRIKRVKTRGKSFVDIDNDRDNRISPVELSVIFPDLTMERFKAYDKNKDGFLDEGELREAMKNQ
ncbi:MAG: hypothetical protein N2596_06625 [Syntrophorhabdaceae bacterium]|nr:hypothetical protein [Syntrophorhabdaceae bacterium]